MSIRLASSAVLRKSPEDSRVFLVRRSPKLRFFGGYWAFAGGTVSRLDGAGADPPGGDGSPDLGPLVRCAARECLEELGLDFSEGKAPLRDDERTQVRKQVLAVGADYAGLLRGLGRTLPAERFLPAVRLLTPPHHAVRYDTQFFLLDLSRWPGAGEPGVWPGELVEGEWAEPAVWIDRWKKGEILIAPPVLLILDVLASSRGEESLSRLQAFSRRLRDGGGFHAIFYSPGVQLLPLRAPTLPPATHTNGYLVGTDPAYLVDPATPHPDEQERLARTLDSPSKTGLVPARRLAAVLLTHHHPDHVGAVRFIRDRFGLPVWAHAITRRLLAGTIEIDRTLEDGERLPLGSSPDGRPGWELEVFHTPGHAAGHLAFFERRFGSLIAGDMISTVSSVLIDPEDGDMSDYMESLRVLADLPSRIVHPSHGPPASSGAEAIRAQIRHREERESAILRAIGGGAADFGAVVRQVYADVPVSAHPYAVRSVESVCRKLVREGELTLTRGRLEIPA